MNPEAPQPTDSQTTETFEQAVNRFNQNNELSPDVIERGVKLHESIEKPEGGQRMFPPDYWNQLFSLLNEAQRYKDQEFYRIHGFIPEHKTITVHKKTRDSVNWLQKHIKEIHAEVKKIEEREEQAEAEAREEFERERHIPIN